MYALIWEVFRLLTVAAFALFLTRLIIISFDYIEPFQVRANAWVANRCRRWWLKLTKRG